MEKTLLNSLVSGDVVEIGLNSEFRIVDLYPGRNVQYRKYGIFHSRKEFKHTGGNGPGTLVRLFEGLINPTWATDKSCDNPIVYRIVGSKESKEFSILSKENM